MRGNSDPAAAEHPDLKPGRLIAVAVLLLVASLATGGAASFVLPLLAASLILCIRYIHAPAVLAVPLLTAGGLVAHASLAGDVAISTILTAIVFAAATVPGWLWRREVRRTRAAQERLAELEAEMERARNARGPSAADSQADVERAVGAAAERLQARQATLWDVDGYNLRVHARASTSSRPGGPLRLSGDPLGWVWEQGMRLRIDPAPRWAPPGTIVVADRLRRQDDDGDIVTWAFDPDALPPDDQSFDEAAIYLRGILGLHDATAYAAAGQQRVTALLQRLENMTEDIDPDVFAAELCDIAVTMVGGSGGVIGLWDGEAGEVLAVTGADGGPQPGAQFTAPGSELGLAVRAGAMIARTADEWRIGRTVVATPAERWVTRPRAMAALPLRTPGVTVGVLGVWTSRGRELDPAALELLHLLAPYAAVNLQHARAYGRMRESAEADPLTGLRNRRAFDRVFDAEVQRFERYGRPMSLMVLDLDHFKQVNDTHGHEAGDEVLRRVAALISAGIRDVDTAARFGGEEFVVLLPETPLAAAVEVAERVRQAVASARIEWQGVTIPAHVSVGVSAVPERARQPSELLGSADAALYRAKEGGRDRVVAAE